MLSARRLRPNALLHSSSNDRLVFQYVKRRFLILNFTMRLGRSLSVLDRKRPRQGQAVFTLSLERFLSSAWIWRCFSEFMPRGCVCGWPR